MDIWAIVILSAEDHVTLTARTSRTCYVLGHLDVRALGVVIIYIRTRRREKK